MKLGTVTGPLWATKKSPALAGLIFLRVACAEGEVVAADLVGAGRGDRVVLAFGGAARLELNAPIDAAIIAILDETEGENVGS